MGEYFTAEAIIDSRWRGQTFGTAEGIEAAVNGTLPMLGRPGIHRAAFTDGTWAYKVPVWRSVAGSQPNRDEYEAMTQLRRHDPSCPATALVSPVCLWRYEWLVVAVMRVYPDNWDTASNAQRGAFDRAVYKHGRAGHTPHLVDLHGGNIRADRNHRLHIIDLGFGL